jgi:hypothetical protein
LRRQPGQWALLRSSCGPVKGSHHTPRCDIDGNQTINVLSNVAYGLFLFGRDRHKFFGSWLVLA